MSESSKRDAAMELVAGGQNNQYELICDTTEQWLRDEVAEGTTFYAGDAFEAIRLINPEIAPAEKRVMGPVMKRMEKLGILRVVEMTRTATRSHVGLANKWIKI